MNKKYQVFISSTYKDLQEERSAVTQYLLKMGFIPVGMEQFPASNMSQMEYIKMILDDCDYYLLILAGKYGSVDTDGEGFTEKEYNYALSKGIPIMSIVIKDIGMLPSAKCEDTDVGRARLEKFREKVCAGKMVDFYTDIGSLTTVVGAAVYACVQKFPAKGWIRGESTDGAADIEAKIEKYMQEHTASKTDIDALFREEPLILDCGNASLYSKENSDSQSGVMAQETISLDGARTLIEEFTKRIPKITMGKEEPKELKEGEIYLQYE